jgi:ComF family protein
VLYIKQPTCIICQKPSDHGITHHSCLGTCPIYQTTTIFQYKGAGKSIVKQFKYGLRHRDFIDVLGKLDSSWQKELDYLICHTLNLTLQPMPLHNNKLKKRGFNQAEIIATFLQSKYNIPIINSLIRTKNTPPQAQIKDRTHRGKNVKNAFSLKKGQSITNYNILLIDDLYTSGATAIEAARELKKHGCSKVYLFTIAHGIR